MKIQFSSTFHQPKKPRPYHAARCTCLNIRLIINGKIVPHPIMWGSEQLVKWRGGGGGERHKKHAH